MTQAGRAVFLSYAKQDAAAAGRICTALRDAGIEVWFDESELRGGDAWDAAIRRHIKACTLFIAVVSRNTQSRTEGYFRLEWKLVVDRSHLMAHDRAFLLPVAIDDTDQDEERVPDRFRELQWSRLPDGNATPAFVARVRQLLQAGNGGAAAPASATAATTSMAAPMGPTPPDSPVAMRPPAARRAVWRWLARRCG